MSMIRTTIRIPKDLHKDLMMRALSLNISFNELINKKITTPEVSEKDIDKQIKKDLAFFRSLGKKLPKNFDPVKAIREERDRDNV